MFHGTYTAIVTPFTGNGDIDYAKFKELINDQVDGGVDGIVPVGTTGESPTLNFDEHKKVIEVAVETVAGRGKVIAGTGGNSTLEAIELTRHAKEAGADGTLQVTPYYNKPSQAGLMAHFKAVADLGLPVVLYNIPGRTSREITLDSMIELSRHPNIVAVKEAAGSVDQVSRYARLCDIEVVSGDDALTLPMMLVGAVGVISVSSNIIPREMTDMVHHALAGRWEEARQLHQRYHRLFSDLFIDTNPIPIKSAMAMMGRIEPQFRLPLCAMSETHQQQLRETLKAYELV